MTALAKIKATQNGQSVQLASDLYAFRVPKQRFRHGQSYALVREQQQLILIDAVHDITKAAVDALRERYSVAALLITHSDLVAQAFDDIPVLANWLGAPVYAHPADHRGAVIGDVTKEADFLARYNLSAHTIPGHTPGSTVYYDQNYQRLFVGDAAVGNNYEKQGTPFTHAPIPAALWQNFVQGWQRAPSSVKQVFPLHGQPDFELENLDVFLTSMYDRQNVMKE